MEWFNFLDLRKVELETSDHRCAEGSANVGALAHVGQ